MEVDFSRLYSLLELDPGCSLEELRHAYRKRVAELHPDRRASDARNDEDGAQLATLIPLYRMAISFHDLHGRLPGSATGTQPPTHGEDSDAKNAPQMPQVLPVRTSPRAQPSTSMPRSHWWLLLVLASLIGYLVLSALPGDDASPTRSNATP